MSGGGGGGGGGRSERVVEVRGWWEGGCVRVRVSVREGEGEGGCGCVCVCASVCERVRRVRRVSEGEGESEWASVFGRGARAGARSVFGREDTKSERQRASDRRGKQQQE